MAHLISIAVEQVSEWVLRWAARAWVHLCFLQAVWLCGHSLSLDFRGLSSKMRVRKPDSALSPS